MRPGFNFLHWRPGPGAAGLTGLAGHGGGGGFLTIFSLRQVNVLDVPNGKRRAVVGRVVQDLGAGAGEQLVTLRLDWMD